MFEALIAGERDPQTAGRPGPRTAPGQTRRLVEALTGRFDDHHAVPRPDAARPDRRPDDADRPAHHAASTPLIADDPHRADPVRHTHRQLGWRARLPAIERLSEIPGIGRNAAQIIIAEIGLDMSAFPTAGAPCLLGEAVSPHRPVRAQNAAARPARATPTSKARSATPPPAPPGPTPSSANATGAWSNAAANSKPSSPSPAPSSSSSGTYSPTPPPATATSAPTTTTTHVDTDRKTRNLVRQLEALGHTVTLQTAA